MCTCAITKVLDSKGDVLVCMSRPFDGYQEVHGKDLLAFFDAIIEIDGVGCLAAQMIGYFKTEVGDFYLVPANTQLDNIDYVYTIYPLEEANTPELCIKVECGYDTKEILYEGLVKEYTAKDIEDK